MFNGGFRVCQSAIGSETEFPKIPPCAPITILWYRSRSGWSLLARWPRSTLGKELSYDCRDGGLHGMVYGVRRLGLVRRVEFCAVDSLFG